MLHQSAYDPRPSSDRPSVVIASQRQTIRELEAMVDLLKGALAAHGIDSDLMRPGWFSCLTPQEASLIGALYAAYPRAVRSEGLLEALPGRDHVEDRQTKIVAVKVCHVRQKLGKGAIINIHGFGYKLSAELYERMRRDQDEPSLAKAA